MLTFESERTCIGQIKSLKRGWKNQFQRKLCWIRGKAKEGNHKLTNKIKTNGEIKSKTPTKIGFGYCYKNLNGSLLVRGSIVLRLARSRGLIAILKNIATNMLKFANERTLLEMRTHKKKMFLFLRDLSIFCGKK